MPPQQGMAIAWSRSCNIRQRNPLVAEETVAGVPVYPKALFTIRQDSRVAGQSGFLYWRVAGGVLHGIGGFVRGHRMYSFAFLLAG